MENLKITSVIPSYWTVPKYSLGQRIKQGMIVGIQYCLPDNLLAESSDGSWQYIVQVSTNNKDKQVEDLQEHEVQPLAPQELRRLLTAEIEAHQRKMVVLTQQLP
ncbi:hypothetical protein [Nostoc sp. MG11]|uniref:hypothetical protein n=1 Tax=Nostoc sp. MG11 TaxID=2721166 RepID=UPI001868C8DC|nr:hypothetical protein [Nostoc sp. MG11]